MLNLIGLHLKQIILYFFSSCFMYYCFYSFVLFFVAFVYFYVAVPSTTIVLKWSDTLVHHLTSQIEYSATRSIPLILHLPPFTRLTPHYQEHAAYAHTHKSRAVCLWSTPFIHSFIHSFIHLFIQRKSSLIT